MKTVKANAQLISHNIHPYKLIERIGRICYKSEDKITDDSASKFVQMLAKSGHTATELEWQHILNLRYHGTTEKPHPQMYEIMDIAYPQLVEASEHRLS